MKSGSLEGSDSTCLADAWTSRVTYLLIRQSGVCKLAHMTHSQCS